MQTECSDCGGPLSAADLEHNNGQCAECRCPLGKVAELDVAILAPSAYPEPGPLWQEAIGLAEKVCGDWGAMKRRLRADGQHKFMQWPVEKLVEWLNDAAKPKAALRSVVYHGDGLFVVGNEPLRLEGQEQLVMEALVELRAGSKDQLVAKSGVSDAVDVLKRVKKKYPGLADAIVLPGKPNRGGYRLILAER